MRCWAGRKRSGRRESERRREGDAISLSHAFFDRSFFSLLFFLPLALDSPSTRSLARSRQHHHDAPGAPAIVAERVEEARNTKSCGSTSKRKKRKRVRSSLSSIFVKVFFFSNSCSPHKKRNSSMDSLRPTAPGAGSCGCGTRCPALAGGSCRCGCACLLSSSDARRELAERLEHQQRQHRRPPPSSSSKKDKDAAAAAQALTALSGLVGQQQEGEAQALLLQASKKKGGGCCKAAGGNIIIDRDYRRRQQRRTTRPPPTRRRDMKRTTQSSKGSLPWSPPPWGLLSQVRSCWRGFFDQQRGGARESEREREERKREFERFDRQTPLTSCAWLAAFFSFASVPFPFSHRFSPFSLSLFSPFLQIKTTTAHPSHRRRRPEDLPPPRGRGALGAGGEARRDRGVVAGAELEEVLLPSSSTSPSPSSSSPLLLLRPLRRRRAPGGLRCPLRLDPRRGSRRSPW